MRLGPNKRPAKALVAPSTKRISNLGGRKKQQRSANKNIQRLYTVRGLCRHNQDLLLDIEHNSVRAASTRAHNHLFHYNILHSIC